MCSLIIPGTQFQHKNTASRNNALSLSGKFRYYVCVLLLEKPYGMLHTIIDTHRHSPCLCLLGFFIDSDDGGSM
jgi:hypothetical protein